MNWLPSCVEKINYKILVCKEKNKKIEFINTRKILLLKIKIDNCQIKKGKKCDCLVIYEKIQNFIELKGKNIKEGVKQLENCIQQLKQGEYTIKAFLITSEVPTMTTKVAKFKRDFKKKYSAELIIKTRKHTEYI